MIIIIIINVDEITIIIKIILLLLSW